MRLYVRVRVVCACVGVRILLSKYAVTLVGIVCIMIT